MHYGTSLDQLEIVLLDDPEPIIALRGGVDLGLVAIENSLEGSIGYTLDLLREMQNTICGEVVLKVEHFLVSRSELSQIKKVYSHPAALAQCRRFLREKLPGCEIVTTSSTAQGAKLACADPASAAISSRRAAEIYGMRILAASIQDQESFTRFIVVGRSMPAPSGKDKTSLIFVVKDCPGALYRALKPFASRSINLTKIESRPSKRALGEYVFFIDFDGHVSDPRIRAASDDLSRTCKSVKVLGSYPSATSRLPPLI
jgi:chorismate mutase/prephenate dehydratase